MKPKLFDDLEYRRLTGRHADLLTRKLRGILMPGEYEELKRVSDAMAKAELAHYQAQLRSVVDDYDFAVGLAGDLSGAEL